jgi:hypothetical protein
MALYRQPEKCFLSLPREIRDEVYRLCLLTRHTKRACFLHPAIPHSLDLVILRICRQIHEESSHILYCENAFVRIVTDLKLQATDIAARGVACISSGENTTRCTRVHPSRIDYSLEATLRFRTFYATEWIDEKPIAQLSHNEWHDYRSAQFLVAVEDLSTFCAILCFLKDDRGASIRCWSMDIRLPISRHRPEPVIPSSAKLSELLTPFTHFWGVEHVQTRGLIYDNILMSSLVPNHPPKTMTLLDRLDLLLEFRREAEPSKESNASLETLVICQKALTVHTKFSYALRAVNKNERLPSDHDIYPGVRFKTIERAEWVVIHARLMYSFLDLRLWSRVKEEADLFRRFYLWSLGPCTNLELESRGTLHYYGALASIIESNTISTTEHMEKALGFFKTLKAKNKRESIPDMFVGQRKQLEDLNGRISTGEESDNDSLRRELLSAPNILQWKA